MKTLRKTIIATALVVFAYFSVNTGYALEFTGKLSLGSTGSKVTELQTCLIDMGYELPTFGVDGSFGVETSIAVSRFQKEKGLVNDGVVGEKTAGMLDCKNLVEPKLSETQELKTQTADGAQKKAPEAVSNTSATVIASSLELQKRDTGVFNFKMNLSPFDAPIYVPTVADASSDIEVYTAKGEVVDHATYKTSVRTQAPVVTGADGNSYYKVAEPSVFIYTATITPGAGKYYARLVNVSFTSQNVMDKGYTGFSGLTLGVDPETWTTATVTIEA